MSASANSQADSGLSFEKKKIQPEEKLLRPYFAASLNAYETRTPATRTTSEVCSLQKGSHNTDTFRSVKNCAALAAAPLT